jgi:hypothetical protein
MRQLALPLLILVLAFLLAAFRPTGTPAGAADHGQIVARSMGTENQAAAYSRLSPLLRSILPVLFLVALVGAGSLVFLFARLMVRRPKKSEFEYYYERPHASGTDLIMLFLVILLVAALVIFGLHAGLAPREVPSQPSAITVQHQQIAANESPHASITAAPLNRRSPTGPSIVWTVLLNALGVVLVLLFYVVRNHQASVRAGRGLARSPHLPPANSPRRNVDDNGISSFYDRMCRLLVPVAPFDAWLTPREYAETVRSAGIDCPAILKLTNLFELERYRGESGSTGIEGEMEPGGGRPRVDPASPAVLLESVERSIHKEENIAVRRTSE